MAQHGLYGRAVGADEVKVQVGRMVEYDDIPLDSAHLGEVIPPSLEIPSVVRVVCRECCLRGTSRIC